MPKLPKLIEEPAPDDAALDGVPVVLAPTTTGVRVGLAVGSGVGITVGTGVGVGIGVDVAVGVAVDVGVAVGVGSASSAVPHAAMSGSSAASRMAIVVSAAFAVFLAVRMFLMVLEWRLAGNFTSMDKMLDKMPLILVSG